MGKHSKPDTLLESVLRVGQEVNWCPNHEDNIHYYGAISIDEGQCSCGARIPQNNSGH